MHIGAVIVAVNDRVVRGMNTTADAIDRAGKLPEAKVPELIFTMARKTRRFVVDRTTRKLPLGVVLCPSPRGIGALICVVKPKSLADLFGLMVGDTILAVNDKIGENERLVRDLLTQERHTALVVETFTKDLTFLLRAKLAEPSAEALMDGDDDPAVLLRGRRTAGGGGGPSARSSSSTQQSWQEENGAPLTPRRMARRVAMQQTLAAVEEAMMQEEYEEAAAGMEAAVPVNNPIRGGLRLDDIRKAGDSRWRMMMAGGQSDAAQARDEEAARDWTGPAEIDVRQAEDVGPDGLADSAAIDNARLQRGLQVKSVKQKIDRASFLVHLHSGTGTNQCMGTMATEMAGAVFKKASKTSLSEGILFPALMTFQKGTAVMEANRHLQNKDIMSIVQGGGICVTVDGKSVTAPHAVQLMSFVKSSYVPVNIDMTLLAGLTQAQQQSLMADVERRVTERSAGGSSSSSGAAGGPPRRVEQQGGDGAGGAVPNGRPTPTAPPPPPPQPPPPPPPPPITFLIILQQGGQPDTMFVKREIKPANFSKPLREAVIEPFLTHLPLARPLDARRLHCIIGGVEWDASSPTIDFKRGDANVKVLLKDDFAMALAISAGECTGDGPKRPPPSQAAVPAGLPTQTNVSTPAMGEVLSNRSGGNPVRGPAEIEMAPVRSRAEVNMSANEETVALNLMIEGLRGANGGGSSSEVEQLESALRQRQEAQQEEVTQWL